MSSRPSVVFMGTPGFALPSLRILAERAEVKLVITQPDRPSGRGRAMTFPPVKELALSLGIPVIQPDTIKGRRFSSSISELAPDFLVTAAFGRILGASLLRVPRLACLNVHASILPAYRGAAPINHAIMNGDREAGVSIMQMVQELDAGPVYEIRRTEIGPDETAGELTERLSEIGALALIDVMDQFGTRIATEQDPSKVSFAPVMVKSDGLIDWTRDAMAVHCHIRGVTPWPAAFTTWQGCVVKVGRAAVIDSGEDRVIQNPGTVIRQSSEGVDVACGSGVLRIIELQMPGRKLLHASQFIHSSRFETGARFGEPTEPFMKD